MMKSTALKKCGNNLATYLILKSSKLKRNSVNKLIIDRKTVSNDKEIANALNSYFLNVGPNLANKVNHSSASHKDYLLNPTTDTVFLTPTDSIEISKEISSLKNKKSGIDIFKTSLIKFDLHATHINTKSYGSKTTSYKGRQYWNHLPPELKNQEKTKPFKSELKKRCLQKYID